MAKLTFVEYDILALDAERGIHYLTFEDFWARRMEPMQFIPQDAKGPFAHLRAVLQERAREQFHLHQKHRIDALPQGKVSYQQEPFSDYCR